MVFCSSTDYVPVCGFTLIFTYLGIYCDYSTYDLLSFIEFDFDKLETTTIDDLLTFIADAKECNIDSKNLISRLSNAGNKELVDKALRKL